MDFPHLKDTNFPDINGVNVYKYQNNFDYARWQGKVNYKLINVKWNSVYNDVPYFNTVKQRDAWFDAQEGYVDTLESVFNNTPKNSLKVPLPFNDAYHYNYIIIDMPIQTSEKQPLNYANDSMRVKRWFYFIEDMNQLSPSTTELELSIDYWTTFVNTVSIPYLMLERGHAPMMQTNVETYLANPIVNNEYLLAPDFNYGNETIIQTSNYIPIGNGKKYVLFCAPYSSDDFSYFDGTPYSGNSTPPTFDDTSARWGYQIEVDDYEWKYGNTDYTNANLPIHNAVQSGILNGCECFAIEGIYARDFFNEMAKYHVNFIHGIKAMFILDEALFTKTDSFTFNGYTLYIADKKVEYLNLSFNKAQFGFDNKYSKITKLYTSPYSALEITDDNGNIFTAKIENCGNMQMRTEVSLIYPFLNYNVFFSGINGNGTMTYQWEPVYGGLHEKTMWASDFSKFMMNWEIPVYSIYVSAEDEYAANNAAGMAARRQGAIIDYQNAVRYANTTYENTDDSFTTNTTNVAATTATDVTNVDATTTTNVTNVGATTTTNVTNVGATTTTNVTNTQATTSTNVSNTADIQDGLMDNMQDTNDTHDLVTDTLLNGSGVSLTRPASIDTASGFLSATLEANWWKVYNEANTDWWALEQSYDAQADYAIGMSWVNSASAVFGGAASSVGSVASGSISNTGATTVNASASVPLVGGIASAIATQIATPMGLTKDRNLTDIQKGILTDKMGYAQHNLNTVFNAQTAYNHDTKEANNDLRETITERFSDTNGINNTNESRTKTTVDANAARDKATQDANAARDKATQDANAARDKTTQDANAARNKTTQDANAVRTQNTETANADYTRDATVIAEQDKLRQKQREAESQYKNSRLHPPVQYSQYSGDFAPDAYMRRGVRFNIRTQSKSAIAQAGDAMLRFGYALHRVWDMDNGFHYGKNFTYWKAEDIWINDGTGVANVATNAIANILLSGVTVWKDPDKIGTIGIYDNI